MNFFRSHSASPKEGRKWKNRLPLKKMIPQYGRRQVDFRASTSQIHMQTGNKSKSNHLQFNLYKDVNISQLCNNIWNSIYLYILKS